MNPRFSLIIPTKNRSEFLCRLLRYLANQNFGHDVLIGDSSNNDHFQKVAKEVHLLKRKIKITHEKCWNRNTIQTVEHLCQLIDTPYSGLICDDDFISVDGINKCIEFLDHHPEFNGARGLGFLMSLDKNGPYGNLINVCPYGPYSLDSLDSASGEQRLRDFFTKMPSIHSSVIYRTEAWKKMHAGFKLIIGTRPGFIFEELFASVISAIHNKIKSLDCLLVVRQMHEDICRKIPFGEWIADPEWLPACQVLREIVIRDLVAQDQLDEKTAENIFYDVFHQYLYQYFQTGEFKQHTGNHLTGKMKSLLKNVVRNIPGVRKLNKRRKVRALQSALQSSSHFIYPYFDSFQPMWNVISKSHETTH